MKYTFSLEEADYLAHQLFVASTSKPSIQRRRKSWIMTTLAFGLFAYLMDQSDNEFLRNYFLGATLLSMFLFPFFSRWRYRKHYKKQVGEHFSKSFGKKATVEFQAKHISTEDENDSESKISYSQVESINELPEHFLIRLDNGQSLILPKNKIEQLDQLKTDLHELGKKVRLELTDDTNWKWK